ncbi:MAG: hypothetical protein AVDCRST_MAG41-2251, partial [uncultured Corynebacteriales bacterium]
AGPGRDGRGRRAARGRGLPPPDRQRRHQGRVPHRGGERAARRGDQPAGRAAAARGERVDRRRDAGGERAGRAVRRPAVRAGAVAPGGADPLQPVLLALGGPGRGRRPAPAGFRRPPPGGLDNGAGAGRHRGDEVPAVPAGTAIVPGGRGAAGAGADRARPL